MGKIEPCCIPGCKSNSVPEIKDGVKYTFPFPENCELRQKWLNSIPWKGRAPFKCSVVCEMHFKPGDIFKLYKLLLHDGTVNMTFCRPKLRENAVPCIFPSIPGGVLNVTDKKVVVENWYVRKTDQVDMDTVREDPLKICPKDLDCIKMEAQDEDVIVIDDDEIKCEEESKILGTEKLNCDTKYEVKIQSKWKKRGTNPKLTIGKRQASSFLHLQHVPSRKGTKVVNERLSRSTKLQTAQNLLKFNEKCGEKTQQNQIGSNYPLEKEIHQKERVAKTKVVDGQVKELLASMALKKMMRMKVKELRKVKQEFPGVRQ